MTAADRPLRAIPSWQVTLGVALLGLGFLVAAQLAAEGPRVRYTTQERSPLVETATRLQAQQDELKAAHPRPAPSGSRPTEQAGEGSAALVRELNDELQDARIAAGLIPLTGDRHRAPARGLARAGGARTPTRRDYLVGRARPADDRRGAVGRRRRGDRGQRRAHHADDRDHRHRPVDPRQLRVPRRRRTRSPRSGRRRPLRRASARRPGSSTSSGPGPRGSASGSRSRSPRSVDMPAFAGHGHPALRPPRAHAGRPRARRTDRCIDGATS